MPSAENVNLCMNVSLETLEGELTTVMDPVKSAKETSLKH